MSGTTAGLRAASLRAEAAALRGGTSRKATYNILVKNKVTGLGTTLPSPLDRSRH